MLTFVATALLTLCKKEKEIERGGIFKGPDSQVHDGKAWTNIELNKKGNLLHLTISIDDAALNSLPVGAGNNGDGGHDHDNSWILKFHPGGSATPFDHVEIDWNLNGHEPDAIYGKPYFDFHFYLTTPEEVAAIPPDEVDSSKFLKWPAANYLPANYFNAGGVVLQMGCHWVDPTSGEFNGQPFTQTFIYNSYDGKVTFYEPMITLDFLKTNNNFERSIPQPAKVQKKADILPG